MIKLKSRKGYFSKPPCILVMGPHYAGKSTLCRAIAEKYGLKYVSPVQMIENHIRKKTDLGRAAKYMIDHK